MKRSRLLLFVAFAMVLASSPWAADSKPSVFRYGPPETSRRLKEKEVAVLGMNGKPARARALATIRVEGPEPRGLAKVDVRYWTDSFRPDAARLGAEAVVGLHWIHDPQTKTYAATGLAVEYTDSTTVTPCGCVVAVAWPQNASQAKEGTRKDDNESLQRTLAFELERKGYYANETEGTFTTAQAFPAASISVHLGLPIDFVFVPTLAFDHREGNAPARVHGALISLASGDTVWAGATTDSLTAAEATSGLTRASLIGRATGKMITNLPSPPGVSQ